MKGEKKYKVYKLTNFRKIPQLQKLKEEEKFSIEVVGHVLPFKVNNYVIDELIDWDNYQDDPIFHLTFPQREMLSDLDFHQVADLIKKGEREEIWRGVNKIRMNLNPHPDGQIENNIPYLDGVKLSGIQHKYRETILFFPSQGQTCHAYCTFCFRWPQFVGLDRYKFAMTETELLIQYLQAHPEVSDVIITGGDPMIMSPKVFAGYLNALLEADLPSLKNIRIGSKSLSFWPYKFTSEKGADDLLKLFHKVNQQGKHLSFMAHFNHPAELNTEVVQTAVHRIRETGTVIRTQAPLMKHINDCPDTWADLWREQVRLGCIPYYMFVARDTGAQDYFAVPLERCLEIYNQAYRRISGICRSVRGPSMSANPGKVHLLGIQKIDNEKVMVFKFLQARNPEWVGRLFYAKYNPEAIWLNDLEPAFGKNHFFFESFEKECSPVSMKFSYN